MGKLLQDFQYAKFLPSTPSIGGTTVTDPSHVHLSFGFPSSDLFPIAELNESASEAIIKYGKLSLHYSGGEGPIKIRGWIKCRSQTRSMYVKNDNILSTAGAAQAIDLATRILVDPGDEVWVEAPTFFSALQSFRLVGAQIKSFPIDKNGVRVDLIEETLKKARLQNKKMPKLFYCMPNFHNPGGVTLSVERRKKLADLAYEYNFYILEDDAYSDLSFTKHYLPAIYSFGTQRVIYLGTFSKIIGPGIRLGWAIADNIVLEKMRLLMLGSQTSPFTQEIISRLLDNMSFEAHLEKLIFAYRKKRDVMIEAVQEYFSHHVSFHVPEGGFFLWLTFDPKIDTKNFTDQAFQNGVSIVEGRSFYHSIEGFNQLRLCFTYCNEDQIRRGVKILADSYFAYLHAVNA